MVYKRFSLFNLDTRHTAHSRDKTEHSENYSGCFHQPKLLLWAMPDAWSEAVGCFSSIRKWVIIFPSFSVEAAEKSGMKNRTDGHRKGSSFQWLTVRTPTHKYLHFMPHNSPVPVLLAVLFSYVDPSAFKTSVETGNLWNSVPAYLLLQRGLTFIEVSYIRHDSHPALHYHIWLTCAEAHSHQKWESWHFNQEQ